MKFDNGLVIDIASNNGMNDKSHGGAPDTVGIVVPLLEGPSERMSVVEGLRFGNRSRGLSHVTNQTYYSTIQETLRARIVRLLLAAWPILCVALIIARAFNHLTLPWLIVLAPIWLPVAILAVLLLGAMWLDKLSSQIVDK